MKSYSQFISEAVEPAQKAWTDWLNKNPSATKPGGKFYNDDELNKAAKEFMKTFQSTGKPPGWAAGGGGTTPPPQPPKAPETPTPNNKPGVASRLGRGAMGALTVGATGYDIYAGTKERQAKGEPLATALPKASAEAGGGLAGMTAASTAASRILPKNPWINIPGSLVAGAIGYGAGQSAASSVIKKLEDPFGGKERMKQVDAARARQSDRISNQRVQAATQSSRQQASKANVYGATKGSGIVGTGRPTTFNQKANTVTTGGKTVQLPKTQILPGGRVGDLAYRGGKATYLARASVPSRDTVDKSGIGAYALRQLSRTTGIGGQRERDIAAANRERQQAMQNTLRYRQQLGITGTGVSKPPKK